MLVLEVFVSPDIFGWVPASHEAALTDVAEFFKQPKTDTLFPQDPRPCFLPASLSGKPT